ncbi:hypothetical protein J2Z83_002368 [Virgibacillus natechei]|uniref:N-acetyltransferase domain-containing protein n=1 Tax=Virgibacillus natechei TaxID=1216297 RepID=A0ABS4II46_9BACI|nr:hypothetical protein [Virgibacillus natechei]MBP1970250.1 hypothetical protein [Virgibacillus natechei]UZD12804.1 hypothetical protein OLD84_18265 [Virgibacillus natechei]
MEIIGTNNDINFAVTNQFDSKYLNPIILNLLYKANNDWDDYNELYHCCQLIENINRNNNMEVDYHVMIKDKNYIGIALVSRGSIDFNSFFKQPILVSENTNEILIFNYFHICQEGRGNGERWLKEIIMPYYNFKKYKAIYLKSSHPKSFSLYSRLGVEIGSYENNSDNHLMSRKGKIFKIPL